MLYKNRIKSNWSGAPRYDLIIIGAGISGLSTANMWLKNVSDSAVLVLEKNPYPGGYVTTYERGGYVFETTQLFPDIVDILNWLGLEIPLKQFKGGFMRRIMVREDGIEEFRLPSGAENFRDYLCREFPEHAAKIRRWMDASVALFAQVRKLKALPTALDMLAVPFTAPRVVANLNRTYAAYLDRAGITDPRLREVLETFSAFSGVPSSRASAIMTTGAMLSSITRCYRPLGYFDEFPGRLTELFQARGGELRLGAEVEKIVVEDGKATGVRVKGDDRAIGAARIVTTVDVNLAMRKLVGDDQLPSDYLARLEKVVMSPGSLNVGLGLDGKIDLTSLDLDYPYNVVSTGLGTTDRLFDACLAGETAFSPECFHAAVICPSLTTGGPGTVTIRGVPFGLGKWGEWRAQDPEKYAAEKERWGDFFIGIAEKFFIPGLRKHIQVKDISTPATYARWSGSPTGSIYDMAALVTQFGPKRLPMKTPIANLYQPKFAHGLYGSMMNGVQVVDLMLDRGFNGGNSLFSPRAS